MTPAVRPSPLRMGVGYFVIVLAEGFDAQDSQKAGTSGTIQPPSQQEQ
jgi:hypothetical protein